MHRSAVAGTPDAAAAWGCSTEEWNDWRWQLRAAVRSLESLQARLPLTDAERVGVALAERGLRLGITPYYLSLADPRHPCCPVRMQAVPVSDEARVGEGERVDPLGEDDHRPTTSIVHKYPDRVLLLTGNRCAVYCRHCTRRRLTGSAETSFDDAAVDAAVEYVASHPEVRDVLVSGGDPLLASDRALDALLSRLVAIPHVEMLRVGTRAPVVLPMRITRELVETLRRHAPVYVITQFNHPKECTPAAMAACERLVDGGVPVENQTVLLRRVNSTARTLRELGHRLLRHRVRPYYLHQGDLAVGTEHLRTPLATGLEIVGALRGRTSGLAVPHLAVDLPDGGGKVTLQPDPIVRRGAGWTELRGFAGTVHRYPDPVEVDSACPYDAVFYGEGADD